MIFELYFRLYRIVNIYYLCDSEYRSNWLYLYINIFIFKGINVYNLAISVRNTNRRVYEKLQDYVIVCTVI